jgi:hypothetical protein
VCLSVYLPRESFIIAFSPGGSHLCAPSYPTSKRALLGLLGEICDILVEFDTTSGLLAS